MPYIYSTLTAGNRYTNWTLPKDPGQRAEVTTHEDGFREEILIEGGANVATEKLITYKGIRTEVSERQLEALKRNKTFQRHVSQGFLVIQEDKSDPEKVAKNYLKPEDNSAPKTPQSPEFQGDNEDVVKPAEKKGKGKIVSAIREAFE